VPEIVSARIPADTQHVSLLRAVATALAARLDFPIDRIIELQIAVDEVCSRLMAVATDFTRIEVEFEIVDKGMVVRASVDGKRREDREFLTEWSRVILEAIAEDIAPSDDGEIGISLAVSKGSS
jgi:anti-sigma regulatory factor (Ser/Thr protein kinase)